MITGEAPWILRCTCTSSSCGSRCGKRSTPGEPCRANLDPSSRLVRHADRQATWLAPRRRTTVAGQRRGSHRTSLPGSRRRGRYDPSTQPSTAWAPRTALRPVGARGTPPRTTVEHMFPHLEQLNDEQRAAATFDGGPLADPGRRRHREDHHPDVAGGLARRRRHAGRPGPAAHLHPTGRPRDGGPRPDAPRRGGRGPRRDPGRRRHVPLGRPPHAAPPRGGGRPARGLLGARHRGRRRRDRHGPPGARVERDDRPSLPPEGDAARPVLAGRSTRSGRCRR